MKATAPQALLWTSVSLFSASASSFHRTNDRTRHRRSRKKQVYLDQERERKRLAGLFISFEGAERAGKSTQIRMLAERLQTAGWPVKMFREPGHTPLGEA